MISGVIITPLKQIPDERGKVMLMIRSDSSVFTAFGEIYFSCIYPGAVKAWHLHKQMVINYAVPQGSIKLVLYDDRADSTTCGEVFEIFVGTDNYCLVTVPAGVWYGFKGIGTDVAIIANCTTKPHDPQEISRRDAHDPAIPYSWDRKDK
ncbi:MAG: dTDP-4-dehydrorhamnose 3,5-epimerase family protein [Elusimicrobia bacterium]|nr:dTDP-4-dehydrorhamnose 3,5-epimerase family protein [Elusimicrobiota bacterium]